MQFSPCKGKDYCTEEGSKCEGCGRTHEEIASTRALIGSIADYAIEMGYENYAEFAAFIGDKAAKVTKYRLENS
jgi:hypothetical protein